MAETTGLSGPAVGVLTVGALLVYAGFRGVSPLQALRDVSGGKPAPVASKTAGLTNTASSGTTVATPQGTAFGEAVASAAASFSTDHYSQSPVRRVSNGWSDCSSFSAKAFHAAGATGVKTFWTTLNFRTSPMFRQIDTASASAGDIIITPLMSLSGAHMAVVVAPGQAIGQQNSHSNVQNGSFATIMYGKPSFIAMRYVGPIPAKYTGGG
jgi:hypothetical protein